MCFLSDLASSWRLKRNRFGVIRISRLNATPEKITSTFTCSSKSIWAVSIFR
jgi:hypothetical protein